MSAYIILQNIKYRTGRLSFPTDGGWSCAPAASQFINVLNMITVYSLRRRT